MHDVNTKSLSAGVPEFLTQFPGLQVLGLTYFRSPLSRRRRKRHVVVRNAQSPRSVLERSRTSQHRVVSLNAQ